MAVYGWSQWRRGDQSNAAKLLISTWCIRRHIVTITGIFIVSLASGWLLSDTDAQLPYVDSFTTWASIVTTYMVARKVLENWIYWFFIDAISIALYIDRELYLTAILFGIYLVMVFFGGLAWYSAWKKQSVS